MKLYEAIEIIVNDFGKEIISNDKVMNMFMTLSLEMIKS